MIALLILVALLVGMMAWFIVYIVLAAFPPSEPRARTMADVDPLLRQPPRQHAPNCKCPVCS